MRNPDFADMQIGMILFNGFQPQTEQPQTLPQKTVEKLQTVAELLPPTVDEAFQKTNGMDAACLITELNKHPQWKAVWRQTPILAGETMPLGNNEKWGRLRVLSPTQDAMDNLLHDVKLEYAKRLSSAPPNEDFLDQDKYYELMLRLAELRKRPSFARKTNAEAVLKAMPEWSWADYVRRVESADGGRLQVKARKIRWRPVKGYSIIQDGISYKASELGRGRNLTYPKLAETWRKLHSTAAQRPGERPATQQSAVNSKETIPSSLEPNDKKQPQAWKPMQQPATTNALSSQEAQTRPGIDYTAMSPGCSLIDIDVDGTEHRLYLPQHVLGFFDG